MSQLSDMFTEEDIKRKRDRITRKMVKSGISTDLKGNKPNLRLLFELYDKNFFRRQIQKKLDSTNSTLEFTFSKHTKTGGTCSRKGCNWKINIPIGLFRNLFQKGEKNLLTSGIWCDSNLGCLQITFEHELIHLLMQLYQYQDKTPESNQTNDTFTVHGKLFQCMVFLYFGHTEFTHSLLLGEASTLLKREDIKLGMRVKFKGRDNEERHGIVVKLNPKSAKVKVDGGNEWSVGYGGLSLSDKKILGEDVSLPDVPKDINWFRPDAPNAPFEKDKFKVGMKVVYFYKGIEYHGTITRINAKRASVEQHNGLVGLIPYSMLKIDNSAHSADAPLFKEKNIKNDIRVGDRVKIRIKPGVTENGIITKKNPSKAIVTTDDGKTWNVPYNNILSKIS